MVKYVTTNDYGIQICERNNTQYSITPGAADRLYCHMGAGVKEFVSPTTTMGDGYGINLPTCTAITTFLPSVSAQYVYATSFTELINKVSSTSVGGAVFKVTGSTGMPNSNNSWYGFAYSNAAQSYAFVLCMSFGTSVYTKACTNTTWTNWRTI